MDTADPFAALVREFELELLQLKQIVALLEEEAHALASGEPEHLAAISTEKLRQVNALEQYVARRATLVQVQGFTADPKGLAACAAAAGERGRRLVGAWKRVAEATAEAQDLNEQNTALARTRLASFAGGAPQPAADGGTLSAAPSI